MPDLVSGIYFPAPIVLKDIKLGIPSIDFHQIKTRPVFLLAQLLFL
jgi:hypothetical protein